MFRRQQTAIAIAGGCEQAKYSEDGYKAHAAKCSLQVPPRYITFGAGTQRLLLLVSTLASISALHESLIVAAAEHATHYTRRQQRVGFCFIFLDLTLGSRVTAQQLRCINCTPWYFGTIHPCREATCASFNLFTLIGPISASWCRMGCCL